MADKSSATETGGPENDEKAKGKSGRVKAKASLARSHVHLLHEAVFVSAGPFLRNASASVFWQVTFKRPKFSKPKGGQMRNRRKREREVWYTLFIDPIPHLFSIDYG